MKNKTNKKILFKQFALFTIAILFFTIYTSCQIEEAEIGVPVNNKNSIDKSYKDIVKNDAFFAKAINELTKSNNFEKTSKGSISNFHLDTKTVRITQSGNATSYTLLIERDKELKNSFENLVIQKAANKPTRYLLLKYDLKKSHNVQFVNDNEHGLYADVKIAKLNSVGNSESTNKGDDCISVPMQMCSYGGDEHIAGPRCQVTYGVVFLFCGEGSSSGGGTGDPDGGIYVPISGGGANATGGGANGVDYGNSTYLPPTALIDENGDMVTDPYAFDPEVITFLNQNPALNNQVKDYLRLHITYNDRSDVMLSLSLMMTNHQLNFNQALALNAYMKAHNNHMAFIMEHNSVAASIANYLLKNNFSQQSQDFVKEMINLGLQESYQQDVNSLINITIQIESNNNNLFEDVFIQTLDPYIDLDLSSPYPPFSPNLLGIKYFLDYRKIRQLNPEWSRGKCMWEASKGIVHLSLDTFGLIPVVGEVADLVSGVLYTVEGDGLNATLSYASSIPIVGWGPAGTRFGLKIINVVNDINSKVKLVWKVLPNGFIHFGSDSYCRYQLRKVLGMVVGDGLQAHHIIPLNMQTNPIIQKAARAAEAFHMNEALNGIPLSTLVHNGSHPHYDNLIIQKLKVFADANPNASPSQCFDKVNEIISQIRTAIANNPTTSINQLNF
jgi:A nuclease family of the HNH/ENDO VII superfamily with conserved AHH